MAATNERNDDMNDTKDLKLDARDIILERMETNHRNTGRPRPAEPLNTRVNNRGTTNGRLLPDDIGKDGPKREVAVLRGQ